LPRRRHLRVAQTNRLKPTGQRATTCLADRHLTTKVMIRNRGLALVTLAVLGAAGIVSTSGAADAGSTIRPRLPHPGPAGLAAPIDSFVDLGAPGPTTGDLEVCRDSLVGSDSGSAAGDADGGNAH